MNLILQILVFVYPVMKILNKKITAKLVLISFFLGLLVIFLFSPTTQLIIVTLLFLGILYKVEGINRLEYTFITILNIQVCFILFTISYLATFVFSIVLLLIYKNLYFKLSNEILKYRVYGLITINTMLFIFFIYGGR